VLKAQEVPNTTLEQQLENLSEATEEETEDDSYYQQLQELRKRPINLNTCSELDFQPFRFLTDLQIKNFFLYRDLLGKLLSIYELQAIPSWDVDAINRIKPFVSVGSAVGMVEDFGQRFNGGSHTLLFRVTQVLEQQQGYVSKNDTTPPAYPGSPQRIFVRYKYVYKNLLQFGMLGDKDAGEQFFKGAQKYGFDFYSIHLFVRNIGRIRHLAIGDYSLNIGQGLLTYQSLAFRKSVDVMNIKRQTEFFRPYNSAGESNFQRGAAINLGFGKWSVAAFVSKTKVSANVNRDTLESEDFISSILDNGLHRTSAEQENRRNVDQFTLGGRVSYRTGRFQSSANLVHYSLSKPLLRAPEPYNQFVFQGKKLTSGSVDYAYTWRNVHVFGEVAADQKWSFAQLHGLIASLNQRVDFSMLYRNMSKDYYTLYGNAFTECTSPINENGFYTGFSIKPFSFLRLDAYADVYKFPWVRYRVDRPSEGGDFLLQLTYKPNKQLEMYMRLRNETKAYNYSNTTQPYKETEDIPRQNWRTHISYRVSPAVTLRARAEVMRYDRGGKQSEQGFLLYTDVFYKPMMKPLSFNARLQYFETDGYNSRIYSYENDVLYSFTIPAFSGKGYRGYFNINYDITRNFSVWFRLARTLQPDAETMGSGNDMIQGNHRTDYRFQVIYSFGGR
jgi:hypothetical protein